MTISPSSSGTLVLVPNKTEKVERGGEKPLNALVRGTTDLDPLGKKEASSSKEHLAMPLNASVRNYNTCHYYYCYLILHSYMLFF